MGEARKRADGLAVDAAKPSGQEPTVREVIPWHVVRERVMAGTAKMAKPSVAKPSTTAADADPQAASGERPVGGAGALVGAVAKANGDAANGLSEDLGDALLEDDEDDASVRSALSSKNASEPPRDTAPPISGVRLPPPPPPLPQPPTPVALSYQVYSLSELESHRSGAFRMSQASFAALPSRGLPVAAPIGRALVATARATFAWARHPAPRPPVTEALGPDAHVLGEAIERGVLAVDWKKTAVVFAIGVGTFVFLLFSVLTAAELTDDLTPARGAARGPSQAEPHAAARAVVEAKGWGAPAEGAPAAPPAGTIELAEALPVDAPTPNAPPEAVAPPEPEPPVAKRAGKKGAVAKAAALGRAPAEIFLP